MRPDAENCSVRNLPKHEELLFHTVPKFSMIGLVCSTRLCRSPPAQNSIAKKSARPLWFAPQVELRPSKGTRLEQADGTPLKHHGERAVRMHASKGQSIAGKFEVRDVHKPIIAAGDLTDGGSGLWFHRSRSYIITKEKEKAAKTTANLRSEVDRKASELQQKQIQLALGSALELS